MVTKVKRVTRIKRVTKAVAAAVCHFLEWPGWFRASS